MWVCLTFPGFKGARHCMVSLSCQEQFTVQLLLWANAGRFQHLPFPINPVLGSSFRHPFCVGWFQGALPTPHEHWLHNSTAEPLGDGHQLWRRTTATSPKGEFPFGFPKNNNQKQAPSTRAPPSSCTSLDCFWGDYQGQLRLSLPWFALKPPMLVVC